MLNTAKKQVNTLSTAKLQALVTQSRQMLADAESGQWEKVAAGEAQRRQQLEKLFASPVDASDVKDVDCIIREILQINHRLESITISACKTAKSRTDTVVSGRRAVSQYAMHSS